MISKVKTDKEIEAMRVSGHMLASVLDLLAKKIESGMSTTDLADIAKKELRALGGQPTFLGYYGFPDVLCVSINDEVVHGIPSPVNFIEEGDIVGLDFGVTYDGMITDGAITAIVGKVETSIKRLVDTTKKALLTGIDQVHDGVRVGDIAAAVQGVLESQHLGIVRELVGHGVGHQLHEEPNIPNYGHKGTGPVLKKGMTVAIEPMSTLGRHDVYTKADGWTVATQDRSLSAHFEHTVLITDNGAEILTTL